MYKLVKRTSFILFAAGLVLLWFAVPEWTSRAAASSSTGVESVYTDQSRYNPGDSVTITAELSNGTGSDWSGEVQLEIYHLETLVHQDAKALSLASGQHAAVTFSWTAPQEDFRGYFIRIDAGTLGKGASAADVSSDFTKYPRYGYISEFPSSESAEESAAKVAELARHYHINAWQFYDWMWRHDKMIKRSGGSIDPTWLDLFQREISWQTIQNQINAIHQHNGKAMAYAMIYASREGYADYGISPTWGIYQDPYHQRQFDVDFGNGSTYLYLFDPANPNWQNYIFTEYKDAINTAQFDGIHIDQMGQRNDVYDYHGNWIDLSARFTPFLNAAKSALTSNHAERNFMTFNIVDGTVDGWASNDVSTHADADFLYSEIWFLSNSYKELKDYIEQLRENSGGKAVVLAAYMNYEENIGPRYEAEDAVLTNVAVDTDHPGFTGIGFVDEFAEVGDSVEFTIHVPEDGPYSLVFRYGNSTGGNSTLNLYVDDAFVQTLYFYNQPNWATWSHDAWYQVELTQGTHRVKLAYEEGNQGAINLDSLTLGTFDEHSIRLADAMMAASGAMHIELGEDGQMLAHEYYPNRSKTMRQSLKTALKHHYRFITAYENLLFDNDVIANDAGLQFIEIAGLPVSGDGHSNTVWYIQKRTPEYNLIHLINLLGNDNQWRNSASQPVFQSNLETKIYLGADEEISNVYIASPDRNGGQTQELSFTTGTDDRGKFIAFTVPELQYWNMLYMKRSFTEPADSIYEAEDAIKTNVAVNTNHDGFSGSGFVDQFAETNDGVSFVVHADQAGEATLRFRYSNGGSDATRNVYINGKFAGTVDFKHTGGWNAWDDAELTASLPAGYHTIVLWYADENTGALNLDRLKVDRN